MSQSMKQGLEALCGKMEEFLTTKTVVGEPVRFGNIVLLPLIDVTFGVGAGGSDDKGRAGGGIGGRITPSAVLVIVNETVQLVNIKNQDGVNKLIDLVPGVLSKLGSMFGMDKKDNAPETPIIE